VSNNFDPSVFPDALDWDGWCEYYKKLDTDFNTRRDSWLHHDNRCHLCRAKMFLMTDQPFTCPRCGLRTTFADTSKGQFHTCPNCKGHFLVQENNDDNNHTRIPQA
jgi:transcription initiation factor IIE alpha subunit